MNRLRLVTVSTLLAMLLFPAAASATRGGLFVGKDESNSRVKLMVRHDRVVWFSGNPSGSCYGMGVTFIAFRFPSPAQRPGTSANIDRSGRFAVVFKGSRRVSFNDDRRRLTGRVANGVVRGRMVVGGLCWADREFKAFPTRPHRN